jgi:hypothetical protein
VLKQGVLLVAALVGAVLLAGGASAGTKTTEPVTITEVGVGLTVKQVTFTPPNVERGATVRFTVTNNASVKRYFAIGGRVTHLLKPKQSQVFFLVFDFRGQFPFKSWGATKAAHVLKGKFVVT